MTKLKKLLIAAALTGSAFVFQPPAAEAVKINWCNLCSFSGACYSCCRCAGYTEGECVDICNQ